MEFRSSIWQTLLDQGQVWGADFENQGRFLKNRLKTAKNWFFGFLRFLGLKNAQISRFWAPTAYLCI